MIEAQVTIGERDKLFRELNREIKGHAAAEEQALWSTVLRHPESTDAGRHAVAEHKKIDDMFADLAARNMKLKGWLRRFGEAKKLYLHHIREEEQGAIRRIGKDSDPCGSSLHTSRLHSSQTRGKGKSQALSQD
jgi:hypothetical protein